MNYKCIFLFLMAVLVSSLKGQGQGNLPEVLAAVEKNNRTLAAGRQQLNAQVLGFRTGLNPANPVAVYDYLKGSPAEAGNQTDVSLTQSLDFPTAYFRKRELASRQSRHAGSELAVRRQEVLLQAHLIYLESIFQNKRALALTGRIRHLEKLVSDYQKALQQGNVGILDVNKARLQLINLQHEQRLTTARQLRLSQQLAELNGGQPLAVSDTVYAGMPALPPFEVLDSLIEARDPIVRTITEQLSVSEKQVDVTRALTLPKVETGYRYQAILGQRYQGFHLGVSIPLWENKNAVQAQKARVNWREAQLQEHRLEHQSLNRQLYSQYESLQQSLSAYRQVLTSANNEALLRKALRLGEISSVTYFQELGYLYSSLDTYLEMEKEYHQVIARLYKFQL
jgi:outer membrane protein, heavy metal efflux system